MDFKVVLERINMYDCNICKTGFIDVTAYMRHILKHVDKAYVKVTNNKIYECKFCRAASLKEDSLKLHQLIHINQNVRLNHIKNIEDQKHYVNGKIIRKHICLDCDRKFTHESTLEAHSAIHKPFTYVCFCGIGYFSEVDFKGHQTVVHKDTVMTQTDNKDRKVIYKDSDDETTNNNNISESEDSKNYHDYGKKKPKYTMKKNAKIKEKSIKKEPNILPKKKLDCAVCGKTLKYGNMQRHMNAFHLGQKIYECTKCKRSFCHKKNYDLHMAAYEKYRCQYCGKQFKNMSAKLLHERVHTGEKPYLCKFCAKSFADPSALLRHKRTHTKEYKYFCDICPKKFTDKSGLISHKLRHGDRKIKCEICDKMFYHKSDLGKHSQVHAQIKNFECHDCGKKFILKNYLCIHIKRCEVKISKLNQTNKNCK